MNVIKRNGTTEEVSFDKVLNRLRKLCFESPEIKNANYFDVAQKVCSRIYDNVKTTELDELAAQICSSMILEHPDYGVLGARLIISNHQKNTSPSFSETITMLYNNNNQEPIISKELYETVMANKEKLNNYIDYTRDYLLDYFGFKTLERAYLLKVNKKVVERPQHLFMRVAIGIHGNDIKDALETYDLISKKYFTHATPTLFNAGTKRPQLSSCFLQSINGDSIEGIFDSIKESAMISKHSGGIGIHIHDVRAKGSVIRGTNGMSDGIVPMLKVFNQTGRYVNQCFTPDTWVYSQEGPKQMKDITTNDNLVTIDGEFKKVNEVIVNKVNKEILQIRATNTLFPVRVTKEHELYIIKNQTKTLNFSVIKNRLNKNIIKPEYYNANELNENDLMGFPIPQYIEDNENHDLDYYKFYGMMLGDGHVCKNRNEYGITLGDNKHDIKEFIKEYLNKHKVHFWECDLSGCSSIRWSGNTSIELPREMLYDNEDKKRIFFKFLHLPKHKILKIIEGLLKTDGSNLKELYFTNTSQELIMQMRYLFLRLGILTSGCVKNNIGKTHITKSGRTITNKQISYSLRIPKHPVLKSILQFKKDSMYLKYFEWNNMLWGRIKKIEKIQYEGDVYDFNMIDNHNYLTDMGLVHNSGKRAGSIAVYLEPWHADIFEFLQLKKPHGSEEDRARDLFYALWIPDLFMKRVKENGKWSLMCPDECRGLSDVYGKEFEELYEKYENEGKFRKQISAQELWFKVLECQIESGVPYMLYKDACNEKSNQKNLGTIKSSNLCVAPETKILTSKGYYKIEELQDTEVDIWNGEEWSKTIVKKTGENQELIKVKFSNETELECTPYHKFYIATGKRPSCYPKIKQIEAKDLKPDMKIIKSEYPIITEGNDDFPYPYEHGLFCADGTVELKRDDIKKCVFKAMPFKEYCGNHEKIYSRETNLNESYSDDKYCKALVGKGFPRITLYGEKKKLVKYLSTRLKVQEENNDRIHCRLPHTIKEKYEVPINYNLNIKLRWLEGLLDGDGCVCKSEEQTAIQIASIHKNFLEDIKYLLQTLGCDPKIVLLRIEKKNLLPNHKGEYKLYNCKEIYRLLITSWDCAKLYELGFRPKRLKITGVYPKKNTKRWIFIKNIEYTNRISDTFCFTEQKRGMGIFNGVLTGQCTEIIEYTSPQEIAVCNLASICLPSFIEKNVKNENEFNFKKLHDVTKVIVKNLNKIIDINFYPVDKAKHSNLKNRPIGLGVQGLADTYVMMRYPFDSEEASKLNRDIFETIYHASIERSMELAEKLGPYETFNGSPASNGKLQFDLWGEEPSDRYNWELLKEKVKQNGMRNSLLLAPMPTASTSQIMGFNECIEPFTSNLYKRKTFAGEFILVNKYLITDLINLKLWNKELKDKIMISDGSIQKIEEIPKEIRDLYKTVWEIKQKVLIDQAKERGRYICQSQSMNLFVEDPDLKKLTSMHFYAWSSGLKTGLYYLRSKPKAKQQKFTIDPSIQKFANVEEKDKGESSNKKTQEIVCTDEICTMCSS